MTVRIDKVVLEINGQKLCLSLEDAKKLKDALNDMLGEQKNIVYIPYQTEPWRYNPPTTYPYPYVPSSPIWIYCDSGTNTSESYTATYSVSSGV